MMIKVPLVPLILHTINGIMPVSQGLNTEELSQYAIS